MASVLSSDHMNYLVWRYLQECGYGHAAIQLQRDWGNGNPQSLPFADAVKTFTLRHIVQDGLCYDRIRAEVQQKHASLPGTPTITNGAHDGYKRWGFIDVKKRTANEQHEDSRPSSSGQDTTRKKQRGGVNGVKASSGRRKAIKESHREVTHDNEGANGRDEPMRDASPVHEDPPSRTTLEIGESTGIQSERPSDRASIKLLTDTSIPGGEVLHLHWHHHDPARLEACGFDAWRFYDVNSSDTPDQSPLFTSLAPKDIQSFAVSARAHSSTSGLSAAAIEEESAEDSSAAIYISPASLQDESLAKSDLLLSLNSQTIFLHFSPDNKYLLGVIFDSDSISETNSWILYIWTINPTLSSETNNTTTSSDSQGFHPTTPPATLHLTDQGITAAQWLSPTSFALTGTNVLDIYTVTPHRSTNNVSFASPPQITLLKATTANRAWELLSFDPHSRTLACASPEDGYLGLLSVPADLSALQNPAKANSDTWLFTSHKVHNAQITRMVWQDLSVSSSSSSTVTSQTTSSANTTKYADPSTLHTRFLATAANDGSLKIWDTRNKFVCVWEANMGINVPAMAIAWCPISYTSSARISSEKLSNESDVEMMDVVNHHEDDNSDGDNDQVSHVQNQRQQKISSSTMLAAAGGRSIRVWSVESDFTSRHTTTTTTSSLSLSPSSSTKRDIVKPHVELFATWSAGDEAGNEGQSNHHGKAIGDGAGHNDGQVPVEEESPIHQLAWNCSGKLLAYTQGEKVTVVQVDV